MWKLVNRNPISDSISRKIETSYEGLLERTDIGFKDFKLFKKSVDVVEKFVAQGTCQKRVVVVGIGGSALGARAFCEAVLPLDWQNQILFLDNVDAYMLSKKLEHFGKAEEATWIVISKSGGTIETLSTFDFCRLFIQKTVGVDIVANTVVVTEEKESALYNFATQYKRPVLPIPVSVGGRYSMFTPVGLLPLKILGANLQEVCDGVEKALKDSQFTQTLASEMLASLANSEYIFYLFSYSDRMQAFGFWLQQLWSESLAKAKNRQSEPGPMVSNLVPLRGASDQHSVLQQMMEGRDKKFVCFIRDHQAEHVDWVMEKSVLNNELMVGKHIGQLLAAEAQATADALSEKGVRSMTLKAEAIDSTSLSYLMMTWMLVVATLGEALDINAFDQPGVESGKLLARRVLGSSD